MKLFINAENIDKANGAVTITGAGANHVKNALRLKKGRVITATDGGGTDYALEIAQTRRGCVRFNILNAYKSSTEPNVRVALYQAFITLSKMDFLVEKCVELGIFEITPVFTQFTQIKQDEKIFAKIERLNRVAKSAAQQAGRAYVPKVKPALLFADAVREMKRFDLAFAPWENETEQKVASVAKNFRGGEAAFMIGPEGGFSQSETACFTQNNIPKVTLGKRVLRAETAPIVCLTVFYNELGEL